MLRLFTNISIPAHIALLVLIVGIRLPSLLGGYYMHDESLYMICAQRLAMGGSLYTDAWFEGPPLIVFIYYGCYWLFGSASLFMMRLLACFYVYVCAVYFNGMLVEYKPFRRYSVLPAVLFALLVSTPWYAQEFGATLFALLPILISFHAIIRLDESRTRSFTLLFQAGLLMALCILAEYKSIFILVGLMLTYLFLKSPRLDQLFSLIGGVLVAVGTFLLYLFFTGGFRAFLDVGALYYLDRIGFGAAELYDYHPRENFLIWVISGGGLLLLSLLAYVHFRLRYYNYVVKIRSLESTMSMWLLVVVATLLVKIRRLELQDFILFAPPLVFYASKAFDFPWVQRLRYPILLALFSGFLFLYASYWGLRYPASMSALRPLSEERWRHGNTWRAFDPQDPLINYFRDQDLEDGIWILDDDPRLYLELGTYCANKYVDFRVVFNKFDVFPSSRPEALISSPEDEEKIFRQLERNPPDFIIDPHENFSYLQQRFPGLLGGYQRDEVAGYAIYRAEPERTPAF